ncbi:uncharacterized protein LOC129724935 [Wyeomyia smithii]|uniref:uncharacterized protein LOC129724935 n=1 Tax=Wyeomyia smithii TaxID=174621 RepID=UPI0024681F41|nr:uncharacterized protein LOC129724935 [Wyeomyia smithii]
MERYLRFYIKFHGYVLALASFAGAILTLTFFNYSKDMVYPLERFYDYRFMGSGMIFFAILWLIVGISMLYGMYKEAKIWIYPFAIAYMLDFFLLFVRDIVLIWNNDPWYEIVLLNPMMALPALYITLHIMLTIVALGKLFEHAPVEPTGTNFVRFKNDARPSVEVQEDITSLLTE